jgi:hypothetical protein
MYLYPEMILMEMVFLLLIIQSFYNDCNYRIEMIIKWLEVIEDYNFH